MKTAMPKYGAPPTGAQREVSKVRIADNSRAVNGAGRVHFHLGPEVRAAAERAAAARGASFSATLADAVRAGLPHLTADGRAHGSR